jgi:hypothetical protein
LPSKHRCHRLLLHERFVDIRSAISREKVIKGWTRAKKLTLIAQENPEFKDLAAQHGWQMLHPQQNISDQDHHANFPVKPQNPNPRANQGESRGAEVSPKRLEWK